MSIEILYLNSKEQVAGVLADDELLSIDVEWFRETDNWIPSDEIDLTPSKFAELSLKLKGIPKRGTDSRYDEYFKDVSGLNRIDVYRVHKLFNVQDEPLCHASKKILLAGNRTGQKSIIKDIQEAIDSLERFLEMCQEDNEL